MNKKAMSKAVDWACGHCGYINLTPDKSCIRCGTPDNYHQYRRTPAANITDIMLQRVKADWRDQDMKQLAKELSAKFACKDDILEYIRNWKG